MSFSSIGETDVWPRVKRAIDSERARRMGNLLHVATLEAMRKEQGYLEALDWVLGEAKPRPEPKEDEE